MVNPVGSAGFVSNVLSVGKSQEAEDQKKTVVNASANPVDEVSISEEAQNVSKAMKDASQAYKALSSQPDVTLSSSNTERLNALV